jgi:hypothetical protein
VGLRDMRRALLGVDAAGTRAWSTRVLA